VLQSSCVIEEVRKLVCKVYAFSEQPIPLCSCSSQQRVSVMELLAEREAMVCLPLLAVEEDQGMGSSHS